MEEKRENGSRIRKEDASLSAGQQMAASCSGALLTSLLGSWDMHRFYEWCHAVFVGFALTVPGANPVWAHLSYHHSTPKCSSVTPLDVVKVRLQAQQRPATAGPVQSVFGSLYQCLCSYCAPPRGCLAEITATSARECVQCGTFTLNAQMTAIPNKFSGTMDAVLKIWRYEGLRSLWSGLSPTLLISVPQTVIYYSTYDRLKYYMGYRESDLSTLHISPVAGAISRVGAVTLTSPLELVRTKMQSQRLSLPEISGAVRSALHEGGPRALMQGLPPTLLRDVPFSAIYWFGYEYIKSCRLQQYNRQELNFTESFLAGALSGTVAAILTLPFDVIKTHQQMALGESTQPGQNKATLTMFRELYRTRGIQSLFAGFVPRIVKIAPACAIMISSYEFSKSYLIQKNLAKLSTGVDF